MEGRQLAVNIVSTYGIAANGWRPFVRIFLFATALMAADGRDDAVRERMMLRSGGQSRIAPAAVTESRANDWIYIPATAARMTVGCRSAPQVGR
jgi:hypothetical protein